MPTDRTLEWGNKLAELVVQKAAAHPPAENAVNDQLTGIDGTGIATLVSKLTKPSKSYGGFALVFKHDTDHKDFEWLQFITRQLVVKDKVITGNLVTKTNTASYQLVNFPTEITDYDFAIGSEPPNWNTCWKVDSSIFSLPKPFYRQEYEYAISDDHKLTAIMDAPSVMVGKRPIKTLKSSYHDIPDGLVVMEEALGKNNGISRAYFSDYLAKRVDDKYRIYARFDFSLTWEVKGVRQAKDVDKSHFTLRSLGATKTSSLLDCHVDALMHETMPGNPDQASIEPWNNFRGSILS
ncbi:hypothetical protein HDV63DRAFT_224251 [Trichoderma sp. SZMC 28014]